MKQENKKPLYKVLNEQKEGKDWTRINGNKFFPSIAMFKMEVPEEDIGTANVKNCLTISYSGNNNQNATADYICLAVNNLHHLAEALEEQIKYSNGACPPHILQRSLEALSRITAY